MEQFNFLKRKTVEKNTTKIKRLLESFKRKFPNAKTTALLAFFSTAGFQVDAKDIDAYTAQASAADKNFKTEVEVTPVDISAREGDITSPTNPFFVEGFGDDGDTEVGSEEGMEPSLEKGIFPEMTDRELLGNLDDIPEVGPEIFSADAPLVVTFEQTELSEGSVEEDLLPTFYPEDLGRMFKKDSNKFFEVSHKSGYSMEESRWKKLCEKYPNMTLGEYLAGQGISGAGVLNELSEHVLLMDVGKSLKEYRKKATSAESGTAIEDRPIVIDEYGNLYLKLCRNRIRLVEIQKPPVPVRVVKVEPVTPAIVTLEKVIGDPNLKYTQERMFQSVRCVDGILHFTYTSRYMIPKGYMPKNPDGTVDTSMPTAQKDTVLVHFFEDQVLNNPKTGRPFDCRTETIVYCAPAIPVQYCTQMYSPQYIQQNFLPPQNGQYVPRERYAVWSPASANTNPQPSSAYAPVSTNVGQNQPPRLSGAPVSTNAQFHMYSSQTLPPDIKTAIQRAGPVSTGTLFSVR